MAVVLDTNVFVSAALSAHGPSAALLRATRDGRLDVVVSPLLLAEIRDDAADDYLVHLARHAGVDCIISGDTDLTDESLDPPTLTPRQAIDRYGLQ